MTLLKKTAVTALLAWTLVLTVARAWRTPNDFAEAHWLLDYRFGFVKRGLPGEILSQLSNLFNTTISATLIAHIATVIFLFFCLSLMGISLRIIYRSRWSPASILVTMVFLSSPFIVMSAHLIGYYDSIIIILGVGSIALLIKDQLWFAAAIQGIAMLVHENSMLLIFPAFCFCWWLANQQRQRLALPTLSILPLTLPLLVFASITIGTSIFPADNFVEQYTQRLSSFAFIQEDRNTLVPSWLATTFQESYALQQSRLVLIITDMSDQIRMLPSMLAIFIFLVIAFRIHTVSATSLALLGICFAPQLMHMVAWDSSRIWFYTIFCTYFSLWIYSEYKPDNQDVSASILVSVIVTIANILVLIPLMDQQYERFDIHIKFLLYMPTIIGCLVLGMKPKLPS